MPHKPKKLTDKEKAFVKQYPIDLNATQAAIRAGYSEKTAQQIGSENLSKLVIQEALQTTLDKRALKTEITAEKVILEIGYSALFDPIGMFDEDGMLLEIKDMPENVRRAIASIKVRRVLNFEESTRENKVFDNIVEVKFNDKTKSLDLLMKHLGQYAPDITVTNNIEYNHYTNISNDQSDELRNKFIKLVSSKRQA